MGSRQARALNLEKKDYSPRPCGEAYYHYAASEEVIWAELVG